METHKIVVFDSNINFYSEFKNIIAKLGVNVLNPLCEKQTNNTLLLNADILIVNAYDILMEQKLNIIPAYKKKNKNIKVILLYTNTMPKLLKYFTKETRKIKGVFFNYLICKEKCTPKYLAVFINTL